MPRLHWIAIVSLVIAAVGNFTGYFFNLYRRVAYFDEVLHGFTLFAITLAVVDLLYGRVLTGREHHKLLLILTIGMVGMGLGAAWELLEAAYDAMASGNAIRGKYDTMIDLIADLTGALLAAVISTFRHDSEA